MTPEGSPVTEHGPQLADRDRSPKLVVGLGNPGPEYADTRHNAGFRVVERLAGRLAPIRPGPPFIDGELVAVRHGGEELHLLEPKRFMNCSGPVVASAARLLGLGSGEILIAYDCADLALGRLRLRSRGSSGGHKGVQSIMESLGTDVFPRLRVGIGRPSSDAMIEHVLSVWEPDELPLVREVVDVAVEAIVTVLTDGLAEAMNRFNGRSVAVEPASSTTKEDRTS